MSLRLGELLRFAVVLVGEPARATRLVAEVARAARAHWPEVEVVDRPFGVVRVGVVRTYVEDDASVAVAEPAAEFAELTPLQRAVLVLGTYAGQTTPEIAAALHLGADEVASAHATGLRLLGADSGEASGEEPARWLRDLLDDHADGVTPDVDAVTAALATDPTPDESSPDTFQALFALGGATQDRATVESSAPVRDEAEAAPEPEVPAEALAAPESEVPVEPVSAPEPASAGDDAPVYPALLAGRPARVVLLVATVVVAVVLAVLLTHRTDDRAAAAPRTPAPTPTPTATTPTAKAGAVYAPINRTLPGGRLLGQFFGSGSRTVTSAVYSVAPKRELLVNAVCSGSGRATIGPVTFGRCDGTPVAAAVPSRSIRSVAVRTDAATTWRFVIVDSPPRTTEAALVFPAPAAFGHSSVTERAARATGTGSSRLTLASGTTQRRAAPLRVLLTCSGGDITLATADGQLTDAAIGTCYTGWTYEFDVQRATLPGTLTLSAPASASWSVTVIRG